MQKTGAEWDADAFACAHWCSSQTKDATSVFSGGMQGDLEDTNLCLSVLSR